MLPPSEAARWNPALMDLGATVCRARPRCEACPLARLWAARPGIARGERAAAPRRQAPYAGSDRQWRGRILRALRRHAASVEEEGRPPLAVRTLLARLAATPEERARARSLRPRRGAFGRRRGDVAASAGRGREGEPARAACYA